MCFALFLGARVPPPIVPFLGKWGNGKVYTEPLRDYNAPVRTHFTLPHVVYMGSDRGCGCGFRHTSYQDGFPANWVLPSEQGGDEQVNHESLVAFLREHLPREPFVEFYGCWEGDFALPEKTRTELQLADLVNPGFYFVKLGFCRVNLT